MPESAECHIIAEQLDELLSKKTLNSFQVISGRYTRNTLIGLNDFKKVLPIKLNKVNCKGKFIWFEFEDDWFLFNENEEDILKLEVKQGEMISPEGKKVAQVFSSAESKRKGFRFFTQHTYKIKIFDEKWNKPILLGFFFPPMIEIHRSGDGL